ncbi:MAG: hypothetical protein IKL02_06825 [Kiritimatiellae bacterium]|nr:hypothetical protein [Kiritimatiellia bacterium]
MNTSSRIGLLAFVSSLGLSLSAWAAWQCCSLDSVALCGDKCCKTECASDGTCSGDSVPWAKKKLVTNAVHPNWPESRTKNMVRKWYHSDICKVAFFNSLSPLEIINLSLYFLRIQV